MRIREGKRYVTRDGRTVGPVFRDRLAGLWVCGHWSWWNGGLFLSYMPHPLDLVAEYQEDGK